MLSSNNKPKATLPVISPKSCINGDNCQNIKCTYTHIKRKTCQFGPKCHSIDCTLDHSSNDNNSKWNIKQQRLISNISNQKDSTTKGLLPVLQQKPCRFGDECKDKKCCFSHVNRKKCQHGSACHEKLCTFDHRSSSNPSTWSTVQQQLLPKKEEDLDIDEKDMEDNFEDISDDETDDLSDTVSTVSDISLEDQEQSTGFVLNTFSDTPALSSEEIMDRKRKVRFQFLEKKEKLQQKLKNNIIENAGKETKFLEFKNIIKGEIELLSKQMKSFEKQMEILDNEKPNHIVAKAYMREFKRATNCFPFYGYREEILKKLRDNDILVIIGATGSGKSTQIPQYLLESGLFKNKRMVCTQPRKVAAISLSKRVSEEMDCQKSPLISYKVGGSKILIDNKEFYKNKLLFMTDRVLLNEYCKDKLLSKYNCIVLDEAHERTLFTDILMAELKKLVEHRRKIGKPLKLIITSATINENLFSTYFGGCPIINVPGQLYPVTVYWDKVIDNYVTQAVDKVMSILKKRKDETVKHKLLGDILVFLTNPEEIEKASGAMKKRIRGKYDKEYEVLSLHGKLTPEAQAKVLEPISGKKKIIFANNIAETSITIEGVTTIVDTGRVKERMYDQNRNISLLKVNFISRASSIQRKGRAGRTQPGECYNLYDQVQFDQFNTSQLPEIFKTHLGVVMLQVIQCCLSNNGVSVDEIINYDFIEKPSKENLVKELKKLESLRLIEINNQNMLNIKKEGKITAEMYLEPSIARMIIEGIDLGIHDYTLEIASLMSVSNIIFNRSTEMKEKDEINTSKIIHSQDEGDLISLMCLFDKFKGQPKINQKKWCLDNKLNYYAFKLADLTCHELRRSIKTYLNNKKSKPQLNKEITNKIITTICSGQCANLAYYNGTSKDSYPIYKLVELDQEAYLHPSSVTTTMNPPPKYLLFSELMRTDKLYIKNVTPVSIEMILKYNPKLDQNKLKESVKVPIEIPTPKSTIKQLQNRGGEMLEEIEKEIGYVINISSQNNSLSLEVPEIDKMKCKNKLKQMIERVTKHAQRQLYEYRPQRQKNIRVIVTSGLKVLTLLLKDEYIRLNFRVANSWAEEDLRQKFSNFGEVWDLIKYPNITSSQKAEGYVIYANPTSASNAYKNLKEDSTLQLFPASLEGELSCKEQVPTIIVRWYLTESNGIAFVELKDDKIAKEAYNMLQTTKVLENVELSVDKKKSNQLIIKKLHKLKDDIYLKQMFSQYGFYPDKISVDRKELKEVVDFMETQVCIHSLFTPYKDFDYVDVFPSNNNDKSKKYGKAMAKFKTMTGAVEAISNLNNTTFKGGLLHVSFDLKESIIIPVAVYKHLEKDIDRVIIYIRDNFQCEVICKELSSSKSTKKNKMLQVTTSSNVENFQKSINLLNEIIKGTTITIPNHQFQASKKIFNKLEKELKEKEVLLIPNEKTKQIKLYGLKRNQAEEIVRKNLKEDKQHPPIPVKSLKAIIGKDGEQYEKLKKEFGNDIYIDLKTKSVVIHSSKEKYEKFKKVLHELDKTNLNVSVEFENECPICCSDLNNPPLLCCEHGACFNCFHLQFDNYGFNSQPIYCAQCQSESDISVKDILTIFLDDDASRITQEFDKKCESSLEKYLLLNGENWGYCDKCNQISRVVNGNYYCTFCEKEYCKQCNKESHKGLSCSQNEIDEYLRENTKKCPKCKTHIEKNEGCNHMTCIYCENHFCWICGFSANSGSPIYNHQSSCPGIPTYFDNMNKF